MTLNPWKNHVRRCEYARGEQKLLLVIMFLLDSKSVIPATVRYWPFSWIA